MPHAVRHDDELAGLERRAHTIGVGQADQRIGGHDPHRLDPAVGDRVEHVDRLEAGFVGDDGRAPEPLHQLAMPGVVDLHMGGELVGEPADFPSAHRVGLSGERERPHA